jgi:hypothetical protein
MAIAFVHFLGEIWGKVLRPVEAKAQDFAGLVEFKYPKIERNGC